MRSLSTVSRTNRVRADLLQPGLQLPACWQPSVFGERGMKITLKNCTLVKPAKETPNCILWNSNVDLVIPRIHIPTVYFYKSNGKNADAFNCGHLKEALGKALVPFYPMAGRLLDKGRGRVDINCNGEGVLFVEADADGYMSEYGEHFAPSMRMRSLIPQVDYSTNSSSFPLLVVQVTFFKCGGVAVGTGVHHHVADGLGALWCLNYWSDIARGVENDATPFFDRTLLRARDPPKPTCTHVEYQPPPLLLNAKDTCRSEGLENGNLSNGCTGHRDNVGGKIAEQMQAKIEISTVQDDNHHIVRNGSIESSDGLHNGLAKSMDESKKSNGVGLANGCGRKAAVMSHATSVNGNHAESDSVSPGLLVDEDGCASSRWSLESFIAGVEDNPNTEYYGPISAELFIFSHEQVESLKARAAKDAVPGDRQFSSYEVLATHVWRCVCLARGLQEVQLTKLYIATDGRSRLQPRLPADYFGNVIFTAAPVLQVGKLLNGSVAAGARHIRETLHVMDNEYLRSALDFLELQPDLSKFSRGAHTFKTPNLGITSWTRLPIYAADFGWGSPLSMVPAGVPFEGLAYLLPGPPDDQRIRLSITLSPDHMAAFQDLIYQI